MATLGAGCLTLADWAKSLDPNGRVAAVIELLSQTNEILQDMRFKQGNLPTGERTTIRTGLPSVYWRLLNQGVATSKSTKAQIDAHCGMLEAWSEVDVDLAKLAPDVGAFRLTEAQAFIEAMNQEMAQTLFYGTAAAAEEFIGLGAHYSAIAGAANAQNILDAGGTGSDNSSIWLIVWGENTVHGIFPKDSEAGLIHEDLGIVTVETTAGVAGSRMRAYQDHFQWKCGVVVKDWRYAVRICNIDISDLTAENVAAANLPKLMKRAMDRIPSYAMGAASFYANRTVKSFLGVQAMDKSQNALSIPAAATQFGNPVRGGLDFFGIPLKTCDALTEAEARIT
ncbi:MAG: hypothetical protein M0Z38_07090 [Deltaproteobacteria bacterium]|nr:hypothetical protein [Deltaproteobacteria bacterium]